MQEQHLGQLPPVDTPTLRKARGAFFTPAAIAAYMTDWAIRTADDEVLEPSCGDAEFLIHSVATLRALGADTPRVSGVEIHADSAATARDRIVGSGGDAEIAVKDFFAVEPHSGYDVVIGNPPYIRYQDFTGKSRAAADAAAASAGVKLSGFASSWAAFTIHATQFLKAGGRLAFVVPAELLSVGYAAPVRSFLLDSFSSVTVVTFEHQVFAEADVDVVLVLADGWQQGPTGHLDILHSLDAEGLSDRLPSRRWTPADRSAKWTPALLGPDVMKAYETAAHGPRFTVLKTWGDTRLGAVTGNNDFFTLTAAQVAEFGLERDVVPISPPKSAHLRGLELSALDMDRLGHVGGRTWLFRPAPVLSAAALAYVVAGEADGVHLTYKCRNRTPWWRVPLPPPPDLFITYMNSDTPRITSNSARVHHLNSVHGIYLGADVRELGRATLALASLNSVTLLGAEVVGRASGRGLLKIEPGEARNLPMPGPGLVRAVAEQLEEVRSEVLAHLANGRLLAAVAAVDDIVLVDGMGISRAELATLRRGREAMAGRRGAKARFRPRGAPRLVHE